MSHFIKYCLIGVGNTAVHWIVSFLLVFLLGQGFANLIGFLAASLLSFVLNGKLNFKTNLTYYKYFLFLGFMSLLAYTVGAIGQHLHLPFILALITFTCASLVFGFLYSKYVVFRKK